MPKYFKCLDEDTWLSESRHEITWKAAQRLALELFPNFSKEIKRVFNERVASKEELTAWMQVFFKVKEYKPQSLPVELSRYYNPIGGIDTVLLARDLKIKPEEAALLVKKLDKALMVAVVEEILQSVKHSYEHGHRIKLIKK